MKRMPIPEHTVIAPEVIREALEQALRAFPNLGAVVRHDSARHPAVRHCGLTRVPYLALCLEGQFELPEADEVSEPFRTRIGPGQAYVFAQDCWVNVLEHNIGQYLRVTFDRDGTLMAVSRRVVPMGQPLGVGDIALEACYLTTPRTALADDLLERLLEEHGEVAGSPANETLRLLLFECARQATQSSRADPQPASARYRALRRYIEENCHLPIDRQSTARAFGIAAETVSRDFARHSPSSFKRTLMSLRLERARKLLRDTRLTIEEVALQSGFTSLNYFSDAFQRATGKRPSVWRNQQS